MKVAILHKIVVHSTQIEPRNNDHQWFQGLSMWQAHQVKLSQLQLSSVLCASVQLLISHSGQHVKDPIMTDHFVFHTEEKLSVQIGLIHCND